MHTTSTAEHILFLTGKLAYKQLEGILQEMHPNEFSYEVRNIGVSVAALMTAQMIGRRLSDVQGVDRIIVPGLCRGDLDRLTGHLGVRCLRGPRHLKDLPGFFGRKGRELDLSHHTVSIFAEITDAPLLNTEDCLHKAEDYRRSGADVIDIGCLPDTPFPHLEELVGALHEAQFKVSVDSMDTDELRRGGQAGADYLLSLNESTLWLVEEVPAIPVLIPEQHGELPSLYRAIDRLVATGREFYADPILEPIHFGFTQSLVRYHALRAAYPAVPIMMGVGNLTELTEADTTGINALLFGIISELDVRAVLTTQVSPHCRRAIREADRARRIMACARKNNSLPKDLDDGLNALHHCRPFLYNIEEVQAMYEDIKDPSYRIQITEEGLHVYNRDGLHCTVDPFALFARLEPLQEDAAHAFYMGVELARAQIAWQLGKPYNQDEELNWGVAADTATTETEGGGSSMHNFEEFRNAGRVCQDQEGGAPTKRRQRRKKPDA